MIPVKQTINESREDANNYPKKLKKEMQYINARQSKEIHKKFSTKISKIKTIIGSVATNMIIVKIECKI